jgi:hypothetical protein
VWLTERIPPQVEMGVGEPQDAHGRYSHPVLPSRGS